MSNPDAVRIIDAAIHSLRKDFLPLLNEDAHRIHFDQVTRMLRYASALIGKREQGLRDYLNSADKLGFDFIKPEVDAVEEKLEEQRIVIQQQIIDQTTTAIAKQKDSRGVANNLETLLDLEREYFLKLDQDIAQGSQVVYRGGRIDCENTVEAEQKYPPLDDQSLTAYLQKKYPDKKLRADGVRFIPGGFSKQTIFFTLHDQDAGCSSNLVIRKDMEYPFIDKSVLNEYGQVENLYQQRFPVAKPLWLESDREIFGGAFMVSERIAGTSDVASWASEPDKAFSACKALAKVMAQLHNYNTQDLGYTDTSVTLTAGQCMERDIDQWIDLFNRKKSEPLPLQQLPLIWLKHNIPAALYQRPARIVHGDIGFHNLMFNQGEITAVLDWEFSVAGDPTQDLCFVRNFVEGLIGWDVFYQVYLGEGGIPLCDDAVFFYNLWTKVRNTIGCVDARSQFDTVLPYEIKFAVAGHVFAPYLYIDECSSLLAHLKQS